MGKRGPLAGNLPTKMYSRATTELLFRQFPCEVRRAPVRTAYPKRGHSVAGGDVPDLSEPSESREDGR
jgi:hypothetical protein